MLLFLTCPTYGEAGSVIVLSVVGVHTYIHTYIHHQECGKTQSIGLTAISLNDGFSHFSFCYIYMRACTHHKTLPVCLESFTR